MKILLLDNYDSFTYNLVHLLKDLNANVEVHAHDKISLEEVKRFDKILLSPGPGLPSEAGILLPLIHEYAASKSILGVCLGEQAIGEAFGAKLINLPTVHHGIASTIKITADDPLFHHLPSQIQVGRYHSWVVSKDNFPDSLEITAIDPENEEIMGLRHRLYDVRGIQFHPESILTPDGKTMIKNWLEC